MLNSGFEKKLRDKGICEAAEKLGVNCERIFFKHGNLNENPYLDYQWIVLPHSLEGLKEGMVIHAIPPKRKTNELPWEEWFVLNGAHHHHILYSYDCEKCEKEVFIEQDDQDHPDRVRGMRWFYFNDSNLTPSLLQASQG